ncbi:MAG: DUF1499 domain-containing protein [Vicinamibacterales bacterium]|nr:DUF1499 domain-containing protein [Vicinamibacterales bacterium]
MTASLISLAVTAVALAGYRTRVLPTGLSLLLFAVALAAAAGGVAVSAFRLVRGATSGSPVSAASLGGLAIGLLILLVPLVTVAGNRRHARGLPSIHDITTDTTDPPRFIDAVSRRVPGENTVDYEGDGVARQQHAAYPDLQPLLVDEPAASVFARLLTAMQGLGWEILGQDAAAGRIEATDTTFWFGFKDDVVVRIRPDGPRTRVDVRSASRVGLGDVGTNARRIRTLTAALASTPR